MPLVGMSWIDEMYVCMYVCYNIIWKIPDPWAMLMLCVWLTLSLVAFQESFIITGVSGTQKSFYHK